MSYWDTSTLVKLYAKETDSATFENQALIGASKAVTSRIAIYEARATFQRKEAEGILQPSAAQQLYSQLLQDVASGQIHLIELGADVEREYGQVLTPLLHAESANSTSHARCLASGLRKGCSGG